jgi:hypothetical protein
MHKAHTAYMHTQRTCSYTHTPGQSISTGEAVCAHSLFSCVLDGPRAMGGLVVVVVLGLTKFTGR